MKSHGILGVLKVDGRIIAVVRAVGGGCTIVEASYVDFDSVTVKKELAYTSSFDAAKAALRLLGGPS